MQVEKRLSEERTQDYWRCDRTAKTIEKGITTSILISTLLGFLGSVWWFFQSVWTASPSEIIGLGGSVLLGAGSVATAWILIYQRTNIRARVRKLLLKHSGRYQVLDELIRANDDSANH